jgi:hypothetical protein
MIQVGKYNTSKFSAVTKKTVLEENVHDLLVPVYTRKSAKQVPGFTSMEEQTDAGTMWQHSLVLTVQTILALSRANI